jgi:hypothetical protein
MSIIQKLEDSYHGILRVVVIVTATLLLVGAVVFGVMSLKGMLPASQGHAAVEKVDPKDVLAKMAPSERASTQADGPKEEQTADEKKVHGPGYDKIFASSSAFVTKYSKGTQSINKDSLFKFLDTKSDVYDTDDLKSGYIDGLAAAMESSLLDARVVARVYLPAAPAKPVRPVPVPVAPPAPAPDQEQNPDAEAAPAVEAVEPVAEAPAVVEKAYKESPVAVVEEVITVYTDMFNQKIEKADEASKEKQMAQAEAKANSTMRMTIAGGVFGLFLLVIFLSIVIRIERNLRTIAAKP